VPPPPPGARGGSGPPDGPDGGSPPSGRRCPGLRRPTCAVRPGPSGTCGRPDRGRPDRPSSGPPSGPPSGAPSGSSGRSSSAAAFRGVVRACSSTPGSSNGSRRRRCGSASRAATRTSSSVDSPRRPGPRPPRRGRRPGRRAAVDVEGRAHGGRPAQRASGGPRRQPGAGRAMRSRTRLGRRRPSGSANAVGSAPRTPSGADHLRPLRWVARGPHLDGQPEPVEQLRPQLALLGVHRADQQEAGGVPDRDALALDVGRAERRRVEQQVDQVVVQQVDLVDVEHAAVGVGEQPGLVGAHALGQGALQVERADQPVLGGPDRQLHQSRRPVLRRPGRGVRAVGAGRVRIGGVAAEPAARDDGQRGQQRGQRPHRRRLGGALLPAHQHPADTRVHPRSAAARAAGRRGRPRREREAGQRRRSGRHGRDPARSTPPPAPPRPAAVTDPIPARRPGPLPGVQESHDAARGGQERGFPELPGRVTGGGGCAGWGGWGACRGR
jgi:hypothetical protein